MHKRGLSSRLVISAATDTILLASGRRETEGQLVPRPPDTHRSGGLLSAHKRQRERMKMAHARAQLCHIGAHSERLPSGRTRVRTRTDEMVNIGSTRPMSNPSLHMALVLQLGTSVLPDVKLCLLGAHQMKCEKGKNNLQVFRIRRRVLISD